MTLLSLKRSLVHRLWLATLAPGRHRFQKALTCPQEVQRRLLEEILRRNGRCAYAEQKGFAGVQAVEAFLRQTPLAGYADHEPFIQAAARGQAYQLTVEPVLGLQPSSGTSAASKLIPYTRTLHRQFMSAVGPWLSKLYAGHPQLIRGSVYWSISPPVARQPGPGAIPVGFVNDAAYLGPLGRWVHAASSAIPDQAIGSAAETDFRFLTLAHLLAAEDLALISVWSPTFLIALLRHLEAHQAEVLDALSRWASSARVRQVASIVGRSPAEQHYHLLWPRLRLISCWTHGISRPYAQMLARWFPGVGLQGKGLVATEAIVSIPWHNDLDPLLAVCSHFFEFISEDTGDLLLAHQLCKGGIYSVVVTTGGGLYRYRLHDLVEVTGFAGRTPALRFLAKDNLVSDHCGEKLNAAHVQRLLAGILDAHGMGNAFHLLAPSRSPDGTLAYVLFLEKSALGPHAAQSLAGGLEERLKDNFHYALCRRLKQLGPARLLLLDPQGSPLDVYYTRMRHRGVKAGDVKLQALDHETGWEQHFAFCHTQASKRAP
jgi:GH3 auxin-responsive promoter